MFVSFNTVVDIRVEFPARSDWDAVTLTAGLSGMELTSIEAVVKMPPPQVGESLTVPPTVTVTARPFSEQVPATM